MSDTVQRLTEKFALRQMIGDSEALTAVFRQIPAAAKCDATVLLSGETGTGKELCARALHYLSARTGHAFVPVNCGAIPVDLIENELFGHERGAYTHAASSQDGLILEAEGGTLFLDEIDCLPLHAQVKVLRFLQEKEYRRVGSSKLQRADVRVIAALNTDPEEAVAAGKVRRDLYYRLNVIYLRLPPLRERLEDIPALARHFTDRYGVAFNRPGIQVSPEAVSRLMLYDWPGNVRELEHVIQRAIVLSETDRIDIGDIHLPRTVVEPAPSFRSAKAAAVADFERTYIRRLLRAHDGNISRAAEAARKHRRAFWQLIRKHRIDVNEFKSARTNPDTA